MSVVTRPHVRPEDIFLVVILMDKPNLIISSHIPLNIFWSSLNPSQTNSSETLANSSIVLALGLTLSLFYIFWIRMKVRYIIKILSKILW